MTDGTLLGVEGYGYRRSPFTDGERIITSAVFALKAGKRSEIEAKMAEIKTRRTEKQPLNYRWRQFLHGRSGQLRFLCGTLDCSETVGT